MRKLLDKLDRRFGRYGIENLMLYIVGAMAIVYFLDLAMYDTLEVSINSLLMFDRAAIFRGEVWRVFTFAFVSPNISPIFIIFELYFCWLVGTGLEAQWGKFKFNVYYFSGLLFTLASGMLTGYATNYYVNLTLFLAFAILYPNFELRLFFLIPVEIKYLAIVDGILLLILFVLSGPGGKIALIVALGNLILFFAPDFIDRIKNAKRRRDFKKKMNGK